jgi:hypothetical protein
MDFTKLALVSDGPELFEFAHEVLDYDPVTGDLSWLYDWGGALAHSKAGSAGRFKHSKEPVYRIKLDGHTYMVGKLVWFWMTGKMPSTIYFKDSNSFNVAWLNLSTERAEVASKTLHKSKNALVNTGEKVG